MEDAIFWGDGGSKACLVRYIHDAPESTITDSFFRARRLANFIFHFDAVHFFRYLHMGGVLWVATHVVLHVYVGGGGYTTIFR